MLYFLPSCVFHPWDCSPNTAPLSEVRGAIDQDLKRRKQKKNLTTSIDIRAMDHHYWKRMSWSLHHSENKYEFIYCRSWSTAFWRGHGQLRSHINDQLLVTKHDGKYFPEKSCQIMNWSESFEMCFCSVIKRKHRNELQPDELFFKQYWSALHPRCLQQPTSSPYLLAHSSDFYFISVSV